MFENGHTRLKRYEIVVLELEEFLEDGAAFGLFVILDVLSCDLLLLSQQELPIELIVHSNSIEK